jgi:uncharacterized protein (DUF169 family)
MCESEEELPERVRIPQRDLGITISLCHAIAMARRYGWTLAVDKHQSCYVGGISMGFLPLLSDVLDGSFQQSLGAVPVMGPEAIQNMPKFEYGKYKYVLMAPVGTATFEPHLILTYGNPAQIWVHLGGYLAGTRKRGGLDVTLTTGAGCTNHITRTIQADEAQFVLVGTGERLVPHPQDYECAFSIPISKIEDTVRGLEAGWRGGISRYPIPSFLRYSSQHPPGYDQMRSHLLGE